MEISRLLVVVAEIQSYDSHNVLQSDKWEFATKTEKAPPQVVELNETRKKPNFTSTHTRWDPKATVTRCPIQFTVSRNLMQPPAEHGSVSERVPCHAMPHPVCSPFLSFLSFITPRKSLESVPCSAGGECRTRSLLLASAQWPERAEQPLKRNNCVAQVYTIWNVSK